ncbi:MAG: hypothetical protein FK731_13805 [Asgard group archaeon]|nr:hypothetical protein [Asgard group archaeon]
MTQKNSKSLFQPSIDFERSEYRYIFYAHDQEELIQDFIDLGFRIHVYKQSPITKTIYFGSRKGLKPGLSIKGRIYSSNQTENIWRLNPNTLFNLLEIKSTIKEDETFLYGFMAEDEHLKSLISDGELKDIPSDIIYRIQKASEGRLLIDSTLKTKSRLSKENIRPELTTNLTLSEIINILTKPSELDEKLSSEVSDLLNEKIRPIYYKSLIPYVMTQYSRIHLIPTDTNLLDIIRVTIDPGVDYYDIILDDPDTFIENPKAIAEYINREKFCRLEFKINPTSIKKTKGLDQTIGSIIRKYKCIGYISKKWSGVTMVSERHINKQAFWREAFGKSISGFFPVDSSWFSYGSVTEGLLQLIKKSKSFKAYEKNPRVLVKNENFVQGFLGVPSPSLIVTVEGPYITYNLPPISYPVKLTKTMPEFYIVEDSINPVRSNIISTRSQLEDILHPSIEIEGYSFFRSYGFLVEGQKSNRIYKLTIERKTSVQEMIADPTSEKLDSKQKTEIYCKMRYIGTEDRLYKIDEQSIFNELEAFYEEFSPFMSEPLTLNKTIYEWD